jgi:hypothetical protein
MPTSEKFVADSKDFIRGHDPKVLYIDTEISPILGWTYRAYEDNLVRIEQDPKIVSVSWAWGDGRIEAKALPDFKYKANRFNIDDGDITLFIYDLVKEATIIVGHNSRRFDVRVIQSRFFAHGLRSPARLVVEDTLAIARRYFMLPKNNLEEVSRYLGLPLRKTKVKHSDVIWDCLDGDEKAWRKMKKYNRRDILLTREIYKAMRGWHIQHYNLNLVKRDGNACPTCLSENVHPDGHRYCKTFVRQKYECRNCGRHWSGERLDYEAEKVLQYN